MAEYRRLAMKETLYIETSVVGYFTSQLTRDLIVAAHQQITREWWKERLNRYSAFVSTLVLEEISMANVDEAGKRLEAVSDFPLLKIIPEVAELANFYFLKLNIPEKARADSYHLALAAWHGMDYLVTWNCAHIANARLKRILEENNIARGIKTPTICTPEELMEV